MRTFVPDEFKHKGKGWKKPLTKKERRQFKRYAGAFSTAAYSTRAKGK